MNQDRLDMDKKAMRRINNKKRIHRILFMVFFLVLVISIGTITYFIQYKYYEGYKVLATSERLDSNTVQYMKYGTKLLRYSRDGAAVIDSTGKMIWNSTYDMKEPKADICEGYIVIGDIGNKVFYVYDENGKYQRIDTVLPIIQIKVAKQGVVAAVLQDKHANKIEIYNPYSNSKNKVLVDFKTTVNEGYPIDVDLSEDGTKLVISYLSINNGVVDNTVTFYSFSGVGDNVVDQIVGVFLYKQELVPQVEFITNDIVCVFAESSFTLYSMKEKPHEIHKEVFQEEIQSIFSDREHIGFVLNTFEEKERYEVKVYDLKGKNVFAEKIEYDFISVDIYGDDIVFLSPLESNIIRLNGRKKFHKVFDKSIYYLIPVNNWNQYYLIDDLQLYKIMLGKEEKE